MDVCIDDEHFSKEKDVIELIKACILYFKLPIVHPMKMNKPKYVDFRILCFVQNPELSSTPYL